MNKYIKKLILVMLLAVNLGGQADDNIKDKVNCAADAIVFNLMFTDKDNAEIPPQRERINVWSNSIKNKLIELGEMPVEANKILEDAVNKSKDSITSIFKDESTTKSEQSEKFNSWWSQATDCINKYSKNCEQK